MKNIFYFLLLGSRFCFCLSQEVNLNLNKCYELTRSRETEECISFLTDLIESKETPNIDRLHYLVRRRNAILVAGDYPSYVRETKNINDLRSSDLECGIEYMLCYHAD